LPGRCRAANHTAGVLFEADGAPFHIQYIEQQQAPTQRFADAGGQLERLGGLHGADDAG
jgi:hypothetical protein